MCRTARIGKAVFRVNRPTLTSPWSANGKAKMLFNVESQQHCLFFPLWCGAEWNWVILSITQYKRCRGHSAKREGHWKTTSHSHGSPACGPCLPFPCSEDGISCSLLKHGANLQSVFCLVTSWARHSCRQVKGRTRVLRLIAPCPEDMVPN